MTQATPTIAFLGSGNMASAIVDGLLARGAAKPADLACLGGADATAAALSARTGIRLAASLDDLITGCDLVVIAFKPQHLAEADPRLAGLTAGKVVVSILAGKRLADLSVVFPAARNLVRCMPNTPGQIGAGITGWCPTRPLSEPDRVAVTTLLGALGEQFEVAENLLDAVTAVSGSGPAYVFEFAAALRDAAGAEGLDPALANRLAIQTLLGSARLLAQRGVDPEVLRNQVTSPNGTTAAGLRCMADRDFRGLIRATVHAARVRSEELSRP